MRSSGLRIRGGVLELCRLVFCWILLPPFFGGQRRYSGMWQPVRGLLGHYLPSCRGNSFQGLRIGAQCCPPMKYESNLLRWLCLGAASGMWRRGLVRGESLGKSRTWCVGLRLSCRQSSLSYVALKERIPQCWLSSMVPVSSARYLVGAGMIHSGRPFSHPRIPPLVSPFPGYEG